MKKRNQINNMFMLELPIAVSQLQETVNQETRSIVGEMSAKIDIILDIRLKEHLSDNQEDI